MGSTIFAMNELLRNSMLTFRIALLAGFVAASMSNSSSLFAAEADAAQQELVALGSAIDEIQSWLVAARSTQTNEVENLQRADLKISDLSQSVSRTESALSDIESEISALSRQAETLDSEKAAQSKILEQAIRTAYLSGNQSTIELLLNQNDISRTTRMLHYHRLFSEAQLDSIASFQKILDEIATVNQDLALKATTLQAEQETLRASLQDLNASKQQREIALRQLRSDIAARSSELEQLEMDQVQLQELIEQINRAVADIPSAMRNAPFDAQRGKLQMPVAGEVLSGFGSRYGEGDLRRQGVTLAVAEGTPVQAIHPGRVVFSDWLRGTGLLVIIDHGEGYMSLYGANQALSKQAGDWVDTGDIVATSGLANDPTGGPGNAQTRPGMYFEIRHHGEAQNPANWFAK
ncbi:MAG: peptidoglycan DD-metalloendopeptidase family protein [Pseudomonadales bacterium]|jgi:septal ring factor EnvC (AmiA/AmiB activator)|nr:peptidoglycan DD-metalloendopeptidase family protein [Pseudomonadales bacterium]